MIHPPSLPSIKRRGMMLVLSSPSGAGKTTLSRLLLDQDRNLSLSISATTRPQRPGEVDGVHYHFISQSEFETKVQNGDFLEYAHVFGNYYGTPKKPVLDGLLAGKDILFDIDWQGTQQLALAARNDIVSVFILPPSLDDLEKRLTSRAQDTSDVVAQRMSKALDEISHWAEYDYIVFNHDIQEALVNLKSILYSQRLKRDRQLGLGDFIRSLK